MTNQPMRGYENHAQPSLSSNPALLPFLSPTMPIHTPSPPKLGPPLTSSGRPFMGPWSACVSRFGSSKCSNACLRNLWEIILKMAIPLFLHNFVSNRSLSHFLSHLEPICTPWLQSTRPQESRLLRRFLITGFPCM